MASREIYRSKNGRFVSKRDLWNGPPTPKHIIDAQWRASMARLGEKLKAQICAPNLLLRDLLASGRVL